MVFSVVFVWSCLVLGLVFGLKSSSSNSPPSPIKTPFLTSNNSDLSFKVSSSSENEQHLAFRAFDGDKNTYWSSKDYSFNENGECAVDSRYAHTQNNMFDPETEYYPTSSKPKPNTSIKGVWVKVELDKPSIVSSLSLDSGDKNGPGSCVLYTSTEKDSNYALVTFTNIDTNVNDFAIQSTIRFEPVTCKYLVLLFTTAGKVLTNSTRSISLKSVSFS